MKKTTYHNQTGFTLIELLVSVALFTIAAMVMITTLYTVNQASRKVRAMQTVLDNLNFAIESMSRNIRTGENIVCGGRGNPDPVNDPNRSFSDGNGCTSIMLDSTLGIAQKVEYTFIKNGTAGTIQKSTSPDDGVTWTPPVVLISPGVSIDAMRFFVDGAKSDDKVQPNVSFFIKGTAEVEGQKAPFSIQSLVSQRNVE